MFISTIEPTKENGEPFDPVRTMSNELVFNTIMTRARSLVYCVGNPFTLCEIGDSRSWKGYLQRCVQCETLQFALPEQIDRKVEIELAAKQLQNIVLPHSVIDQATDIPLTTEADKIIQLYIQKLNQRREYKTGCKLVRRPEGNVDWMMEDEKSMGESVILCRLKFSMHDQAIAIPLDSSQPSFTIKGKENLKGSLEGDTRKVDATGKCVLFDEKTEKAIRQTHYGKSFLCRVSEFNCIQFYPLDKCYPKFVNLPTITREEKRGVVCFDPSSINDTPKVCNVVPHEVALQMVFLVKFLGWKKERGYPLGIIVGAFPSLSQHFQELMLRMKHSIPVSIYDHPMEKQSESNTGIARQRRHFPLAITIDPEGSTDHDDALTCTVKSRGNVKVYTVGVHITDINSIMKKGSKLDKQARQRGCTVYNAPDSICSKMVPASVLDAASIYPGKTIKAFSVLTDFTVTKEGTKNERVQLGSVQFLESSVASEAELTYKEAQDLLLGDVGSYTQSLKEKMKKYDCHQSFPLKQLVRCLWKFAWFLRRKRLKEAALAFTVREVDQLKNPEAHYLVEELMIRANTQVARKLSREFKNKTVLRSQKPPDDKEVKQFADTYKNVLPLSASCKVLFPNQPECITATSLTMMRSQHSMMLENLRNKKFVDVMHCVQMEHLHPQLVALQSRLRSLQSPAEYCVVGDGEDGAHFDLQCSHYTHFTSPLRRYIDVVIQRQLHKVLNSRPTNAVTNVDDQYTQYLKDLCITTQTMLKKAKDYERDIESATFTTNLKTNQRVYDCIISEMDIKQGKITFCFTDVELRLGPKAREITIQQLQRNHSTEKQSPPSEPKMLYQWKAKLCSMNGAPARFLDSSQLEICSSEANTDCQLSFYCPDERNCTMKKRVNFKVKSSVVTVPSEIWRKLQQYTMEGNDSIEAHREEILSKLSSPEEKSTPIPHREWMSILIVYNLKKELRLFDVMKAQLCATQGKKGLTQEPAIQLLEVGPGLQICVHHNKDPEKCFVGKLTQHASKEKYDSLSEYVKCWEPLLLSESALTSVKESEFLIIRDVELTWPKFQLCTSSSGDTYYEITENTSNPEKSGIMIQLSNKFMESSHHFFKMSEGDLICLRVRNDDGQIRYVFHMVISKVAMTGKKADVYMKFVLKHSNYISPQVYELIRVRKAIYEIQLIHSSLPQRYSSIESSYEY